ncbi:hypothetical protein [Paenibacillus xylanexedens]|uniref:hypothetical protein n=1 Tax=Paenibacillus xylanexedens TaxID=528191 RepID=UPI001643C0DC|nr:hypothetical protein [Paenibacillus xylanexedens]
MMPPLLPRTEVGKRRICPQGLGRCARAEQSRERQSKDEIKKGLKRPSIISGPTGIEGIETRACLTINL